VVQLVDALPYKLKGCGFDSWWCHRNFSNHTMVQGSMQSLTGLSTRNISWGGKGDKCTGLTTLPPSCVDWLNSWEPQQPGTFRACPSTAWTLHYQGIIHYAYDYSWWINVFLIFWCQTFLVKLQCIIKIMSYAGWPEDSIFVEYDNVIGYWDPDILMVQTAYKAKGFDYPITMSLSRRMASLDTRLWNPQNLHSITILWVCRKQMLYFMVLNL
jgi:hypothetical protein